MSTAPVTTPPAPASRRRWGCLLPALLIVLLVSVVLNLGTVLVYVGVLENPLEPEPDAIEERFYLGDPDAKDKIAVVRVSGVISGSGIQFPVRQLEAAARDKWVKAVVLRIDSPGGTVTASEELYQNIVNLRDNTGRRFKSTGPKPVSVSMGGVAASGGYYIAVAGKPISAEPTTITGSIGVFAALPNVAEWAKDNGVKLELVKAGGMKAAGSFFHTLSPEERQTWQDTVDNAYDLFLETIARNRPGLNAKDMREKVVIERMVPKRDEKGNPVSDPKGGEKILYQRRLADGGTFTATDAQKHGLIDKVEDLPAVIRASAAANSLGSFKAVVYEQRKGLVERLTGLPIQSKSLPDLKQVSSALTPRLWYLSPTADAGLLQIDP
jgi:protease-4